MENWQFGTAQRQITRSKDKSGSGLGWMENMNQIPEMKQYKLLYNLEENITLG
jgi:hypothetical protein